MIISRTAALPALLALAACHGGGSGSGVPGNADDHEPFGVIARSETLKFTGTEPFWGGSVGEGSLTYTTPEDIEGTTIPVERFAGRAGLSFSGTLDEQPLDMTVTEGECSDGMSDRTYPFTVTLMVKGETRYGCAWSEEHPFTGPESP